MYERGKAESALIEQLAGWTVTPLSEPDAPIQSVGTLRLPQRFGGWWREQVENDEGEQRPTGREVELRLRVLDGRVRIGAVTFRGFDDEFERQGVPAMRDMLVMMFSVLGGEADFPIAASMRATSVDEREGALAEHRRRRRRNAIDHERVAELYRAGGARHLAEVEHVSEATAYRWVKAARAAGVLEGGGAR